MKKWTGPMVAIALTLLIGSGAILVRSSNSVRESTEWTVTVVENVVDRVESHDGICHVLFQKDARIRLNAFAPEFDPNIPGFDGGMYHNILLKPVGDDMLVEREFWVPGEATVETTAEKEYLGPDLFWQRCGSLIKSLPPDVVKIFRGWHGLPR